MVDSARNDPATTDNNEIQIEASKNATDIREILTKKKKRATSSYGNVCHTAIRPSLEIGERKLIGELLNDGLIMLLLSA